MVWTFPKVGRMVDFFPYLPAVSAPGVVVVTLGLTVYCCSFGRASSILVGTQASFNSGVDGLSPLYLPSDCRARFR